MRFIAANPNTHTDTGTDTSTNINIEPNFRAVVDRLIDEGQQDGWLRTDFNIIKNDYLTMLVDMLRNACFTLVNGNKEAEYSHTSLIKKVIKGAGEEGLLKEFLTQSYTSYSLILNNKIEAEEVANLDNILPTTQITNLNLGDGESLNEVELSALAAMLPNVETSNETQNLPVSGDLTSTDDSSL